MGLRGSTWPKDKMAESHVLDLQSLVDLLATRIGGTKAIACKRFFNGAAPLMSRAIFS